MFVLKIILTNQRNKKIPERQRQSERDREIRTIPQMIAPDVRQRDSKMIQHIAKESLKLHLKYTRVFANKRSKRN